MKSSFVVYVLERSLLFIVVLALFLAPARLQAQTHAGQSGSRELGNGQTIKLSPAFLQGRAFTQDAAQNPVNFIDAAGGIIQKPAAPVYDVIALRISFQPDTSRFTTGNGTYAGALFDTLKSNVDPLPHNADYFDAHLQFLSNYVDRVSDGKTVVNTHLIPEVIQVSQEMAAYSPTGFDANSDAEIGKLAKLVEEAWTLADRWSSFNMSGFDPATTALVLFHAGVGRDIELVGTSLDKTPQDLPTIFFNQQSLERLLPASQISFNGFPVQHTILMPRTESRLGFDFIQDQPFLIEFSINGLFAASFFNFLGVPDLFDTSTGESAIGPFGLMDPLGLFAYNGLIPPEPGAWTRLFLGWADLVTVEGAAEQTIELSAVSLEESNVFARIPISPSEYFLVENRNRDPDGDGLNLTIRRDGQTFTQRVENGQEDFNAVNIEGFEGGVLVDVDDFDWAVPGGIDVDGNVLNGGILIWHIDERVLAEGLPANQVNINRTYRAVDVEEADGAQDLGFPSDNIFGPQAFLGSPFDFFYEGNPVVVITGAGEEVRLYQNQFGMSTFPNSNSNAGGPSFIVLDNFSLPGPAMSFRYRRESGTNVTPVDGFDGVADANVPEGSYITSFPDATAGIIFQSSLSQIAVIEKDGDAPVFISSRYVKSPVVLPDGRVAALGANMQQASLLILENGDVTSIPLNRVVHFLPNPSNQLIYDSQENRLIAQIEGSSGFALIEISLDVSSEYQIEPLAGNGALTFSVALTKRSEVAYVGTGGVSCRRCERVWRHDVPEFADVGQLVLGDDASGLVGAFTYTHLSEKTLVFLQADGSTSSVDLNQYQPADASYNLSRLPVLVDLNKDDRLEVLLTFGPHLMAFSAGGGVADGFPIKMPAPSTAQPLVAKLQGSEGWTVIVGASDGYIYAYQPDQRGRQAAGFPLAVGSGILATPLLKDGVLYATDTQGSIKAWDIDQTGAVWWRGQYGHQYNTSYVQVNNLPAGTGETSDNLLITDQNYNWPNPIREGKTYFRLAPSQDVKVTITIIDTAGGLIDKLELENVRGSTTTDVLWQTDASSGLYFARVEAIAADGKNETKLIKMAIVR